jgi:predicted NAD/FAD-binding protein
MRIAIIGAGVSGLTAAHELSAGHDVTLFEKERRAGGHSNTVVVEEQGREIGLDTGFLVYNEHTYPHFTRLLAALGVASQESEMSLSVACRSCGVEWCGRSFRGLFARPAQLFRPSHHRMLLEILRFNRDGAAAAGDERLAHHTIGRFLAERGYSEAFRRHYMLAMGGAIWSSDPATFEQFPLQALLRFLSNHGLLTVSDQPRWRTVCGGSRRYVVAMLRRLEGRVRLGCPVAGVRRRGGLVEIEPANGRSAVFDRVVLATHSDQALRLLRDPSDAEARALRAIRYQPNEAILHTDGRLLPRSPHARASWNVHLADCRDGGAPLSMTYSLNRLQRLPTHTSYCVTLNGAAAIDPERILRRIRYEHPVYDFAALAAQSELRSLSGSRGTYFAGAYLGYGFHEDGVRSALVAVESIEREREAA